MYKTQSHLTEVNNANADACDVTENNNAETWVEKTRQLFGKEHFYLVAILLFFAALYGLLPIYLDGMRMLSHPGALGGFWSPDSGARFAMIRNWVDYGSLVHLHYSYTSIDPTGHIHPLAYFLFHRQHDFLAMYPTLFPFLSGLAYRACGFYGLTLLPALCGLGCLMVTYATAKRLGLRSRLLLVSALGLATPLVIYSAVFWDHSALMLMAALAGYWMLRAAQDGSIRSAVIAGIMIGLGIWLHEQFLALFVAAWLAALPLRRTHRWILTGLPLGFFVVASLWGLFNRYVYGTFAGPHLGANVFQNNSDHPFGLASILNWHGLADRTMVQLVGTTLPTSNFNIPFKLWLFYLSLAGLLVIYSFWSWEANRISDVAISLVILMVAASVALSLVLKISVFATPAGLFQATPLLMPALTVPWYVRGGKAIGFLKNLYYAWLSRTCFLFILFLLINPMYPGMDWGSRYLLTALPLLALLATSALERQYDCLKEKRRSVATTCIAALVGVSLISQGSGLFWIHRTLAYDQHLNLALQPIPTHLIVTDADFNARLYPGPKNQARFLVRTAKDEILFTRVLSQPSVNEFTFLSRASAGKSITMAIAMSGRPFRVVEKHKFFDVDLKREVGDEFHIVRFVLKTQGHNQSVVFTARPLLLHRYSFTGSVNNVVLDRVFSGGSNANLIGGAAIKTPATVEKPFCGLFTSGGAAQGAKLSASAFRQLSGSFTVEQWFTRTDAAADYQTLFSFSKDQLHYLVAHPARGDNGQLSVDFSSGLGETSLNAPAPPPGVQTLLTVTYDAVTDQATLYLDGVQAMSLFIPEGFSLSKIASEADSGINGVSPFKDPSLNGSTSEFRLYQGALTPTQIWQQFQHGPDKLSPL